MANVIAKRAERGILPVFSWKYIQRLISRLPESFAHSLMRPTGAR